jgi:DeoR/GlpR family transcriptional regulator of sugar metabolism
MAKVERKEKIRQFIYEAGETSVTELCEHFGVSEATIRRDLEELDGKGVIQRVHGGALRPDSEPAEPPICQRTHEQGNAKEQIARATADLIADGDTVFLGSGSTVLAVARHLKRNQKRNLTVISNSLPVIDLLSDIPEITVIVLGGLLRQSELSMIGHITEKALAELRADKVVIGIRAIHLEQGLTNDYLPETMTDRAVVQLSNKVILVADHTKFGHTAPAFVAPLSVVNTIVTDSGIAPELVQELRESGVHVIIAGEPLPEG